MNQKDMVIFHYMTILSNFHDFFTSHEIEKGAREYVDPTIGFQNILT
jgi:hypothetical protein